MFWRPLPSTRPVGTIGLFKVATFQLLFVILAVKDIKVNLKSSWKVAEKCYFETPSCLKWEKVKQKWVVLTFHRHSNGSAGLWHAFAACYTLTSCAWVYATCLSTWCQSQHQQASAHCLLPIPHPAHPLPNGNDSKCGVLHLPHIVILVQHLKELLLAFNPVLTVCWKMMAWRW